MVTMEVVLKKSIISVGIFLASMSAVHSQEKEILDYIHLSNLKGDAVLDWQISSGFTCYGIQIYRSVNNSAFIQIGEIKGVCGHSSHPIRYLFKDENPVKNQTNNYRLSLGGYGNTETIGLEIINFEEKNYQIRPNPIITNAQLLFSNERGKEATIKVFDAKGNSLSPLKTNLNFIDINSVNYHSGIYFFNIVIDNKLVTAGKFVVQ